MLRYEIAYSGLAGLVAVSGCGPGHSPKGASAAPSCPAQASSSCPSQARVSATAPDIDAVAEKVVERFNASDAIGLFRLFGANMKTAVPEDRLREILKHLVGEKGKILRRETIERSERESTYRVTAERGPTRQSAR